MTAERIMPPLFAPLRPQPGSPEAAVTQRLRPFFEAGILNGLALHVVARLGRRTQTLDPDVLLALALAVRAPQRGHICVDLSDDNVRRLLPATVDPSAGSVDLTPLVLPVQGWSEKVAACARLVRMAGQPGLTPFVLDGHWLYTDRYWSYQADLAHRLSTMAAQTQGVALAAVDYPMVAQGLDFLFRPPLKNGHWPAESVDLNRQRLAGGVALTRQLAVITGGPGMGKTWTVRNLLALLWLRHQARFDRGEVSTREPAVALAAPTGKAAGRMKEALRAKLQDEFVPSVGRFIDDADRVQRLAEFVQGIETRTLHRLLGWQLSNPTRFRHNAIHPLPYDIVVVDEASMVDFAMMSKLVAAVGGVGPGGEPTRLLLLGDRHQLASVEAGTVLADICGDSQADRAQITQAGAAVLAPFPKLQSHIQAGQSQVQQVAGPPFRDAIVQFNRTYRFGADSGIGQFAAACLHVPFDVQRATDVLTQSSDVALISPALDARLPPRIEDTLLRGYGPYLRMLSEGAADLARFPTQDVFHRRLLETFDRFRVLCAHRAGRTGVRGVNEATLGLLRERRLVTESGRWFLGRPVLVQRNDYNVRRSSGGKGLYNGDIGLVVMANIGGVVQRVVAFPGVDGLPPADPQGVFPALNLNDYQDKRVVEYVVPSRLPEHDTAFAMTIHKSQGSEFEHVLIVLPNEQSPILTRELIYTGVTRAKGQMTMLSSREVLSDALERTVQRASGLRRALWP